MRMRFGVVWCATALTLLAVTAVQADGVSRTSRRLITSAPLAQDSNGVSEGQVNAPTFRPRSSRRREETTPRDAVRARTRSRPPDKPETTTERRSSNERFDSRRTRTRGRPAEAEVKIDTPSREAVIRSRTRQGRRPTQPSPTQATLEVSSPINNESKIETINTNINDFTKTPRDDTINQSRRRSSTTPATDVTPNPKRRGRISSRTNARSLDLDGSGSTNNILVIEKAPTTAQTAFDVRNARKLRYKTRTSETDTNLTGEGIKTLNEVKSSQNESTASQPEIQTSAPVVVERIVQESTEPNKLKTTTLKVMKVVRRPLTRGANSSKITATKAPSTEEIDEDDNYPESFKALIQAKNASTQASVPPKERISFRASQKVYKTLSTSAQSTQNGPSVNKFSRLRKQKAEELSKAKVEVTSQESFTAETPSKIPDFRSRGKFSARSKKITSSTTTGSVTSTSDKPVSKYSRKFKFSTTTRVPQSDNNDREAETKKPFVRPSFHPRRVVNNDKANESIIKPRVVLPRTSYYSRNRNLNKNETSTTTEAVKEEITAQSKAENTADMPIIFTLLKSDEKPILSESLVKDIDAPKEPFIIAVSSTESLEAMNNNELLEMSDRKPVVSMQSSVSMKQDDRNRYHANYKDHNPNTVEDNSHSSSTVIPPVRNIQSRKYGRLRNKPKEKIEDSPDKTTARPRDRNVRKFSETYSKTTEATNNGIIADPEKSKSRFSSKYRASLLNKTFYKPTVPSVTSSTAWLKFFVTDHQTKSLEEAHWFDTQDLDMTTQSVTMNATSPFDHEPSIELVEGEEIQLGPDLNAIVITPTRRTLSSADLRLSESLVKQSQVMNVEASHHSPSVTVSIFDALADILTSTPKPRISSTTEVTTKQPPSTDVTQTHGVSNIVNVYSTEGKPSPDAFAPTDASSSTTQIVQNTVQTPNVINFMSTGDNVTPSLDTKVITPTPTTPFPSTSTPISERRPFAIKVLYTDTDSPTDKPTTAPDLTSKPTTDNPVTVYNTVSDLLLSNPNIVSSELTSMLSSNIIDIIENMDEDSRSKVSVGMAKLLKSLIPRALDGLGTAIDSSDFTPNTTPYSMEDIKDTENVDIDIESPSIVQTVMSVVNNTTRDSDVTITDTPFVNNVGVALLSSDRQTTSSPATSSMEESTSSVLDVETVSVNKELTSLPNNSVSLPFLTNFQIKDFTSSDVNIDRDKTESLRYTAVSSSPAPDYFDVDIQDPSQVSPLQLWILSKKARVLKMIEDLIRQNNDEIATASSFIDVDSPSSNSLNLSQRLTDIMNNMTSTTESSLNTMTDTTTPFTSPTSPIPNPPPTTEQSFQDEATTKGNSDVGSTTLSTTPISIIDESQVTTDSISSLDLSRSPEISAQTATNDLISTTVATTQALQGNNESQTTTASSLSSNLSLSFGTTSQTTTDENIVSTTASTTNTSQVNNESPTTTDSSSDLLSKFGTTPQTTIDSNTIISTTQQSQDLEFARLREATTASNESEATTQGTLETTTVNINTETTTSQNVESTTQGELLSDTTTTESPATTSSPFAEIIDTQNDTTTPVASIGVATPAPIPKKDYVIFGILPNNTVVRKNPNDDVLESLTEASPYIVYGVLPNNTVIRKFPNGTRVPRIMQKIDILPISPWSLRNPYSPIHNNPAIVRPQANPIRVSTNTVTTTDITNNGTENRLTTDTVNNQQMMISSSALNFKSSSLGISPVTNKLPAEKSTASHVLSLRTTTMLPSIDEILLNSISSAAKQEMVISSMTSSTHEPRILTLDIDPETKQIRTEKPSEDGSAVFKFIPIDEIMVPTQNSNVLKLATKAPVTSSTETTEVQVVTAAMGGEGTTQSQMSTTESNMDISDKPNTLTTEIVMAQTNAQLTTGFTFSTEATSTVVPTTTQATTSVPTTLPPTTTTAQVITTTQAETTQGTTTTRSITTTQAATTTQPTTTTSQATTLQATTTEATTTQAPTTMQATTTQAPTTTTTQSPITTTETTTSTTPPSTTVLETSFTQESSRDPKNLNFQSSLNILTGSETTTTTRVVPTSTIIPQNDPNALLQALLSATGQNSFSITNNRVTTTTQPASTRSIEDDIRQYEEDTKLLKALLAATGQNPASLNLPSLDKLTTTRIPTTTFIPTTKTVPTTTMPTTTTRPTTTTTTPTTTTFTPTTTISSTTKSLEDDIKQYNEDVKLLQALLQATGQNQGALNIPQISGITSNVRISSNPKTTSMGSNPTTPMINRPVFTTRKPEYNTFVPGTIITSLGPTLGTTTESNGISTTFSPFDQRRQPSTTERVEYVTLTGRRAPSTTTETPSTSTFSVEEDLMFLQNLKSVLNTNANNEDPEAALANRIISLAVERSLNEIQTGKKDNTVRTGKTVVNNELNAIPTVTTTTPRPTTTTTQATTTTTQATTTTTQATTTTITSIPSIEDDIKQFQEDTKLLQALIQATGQDPSKFNIPTLPNINIATTTVSSKSIDDLKLLTNLLASPSPTHELFDTMTPKPSTMTPVIMTDMTTPLPFGARIVVKDDLRTVQDDGKLIKTLIKLQDAQETTTQRNKIAVTGQTSDEALKNLIQKQKQSTMVSEATRAPMSLSTEYGKSNDALLAALLKEQGFGPTTASSLDEQLRLAALLNQVVVTPKARRPTAPPPPPPPPRRPILDGLAWLWQQWRETGPGPGPQRPSSRPMSASRPSEATSTRVNWFGSGPFVGNADDRPANRVPLEPPRTVTSSQTPGRGQLVSAAINVTRAFSQFLGAAIQGAAQTVQSVFRAGQRAASDVYTNGSAGSG